MPFVRPVLSSSAPAVRGALILVSDAVSARSAEIYAGYRRAPASLFIDAMVSTHSACDALARVAEFLGVEVPPAYDGIGFGQRGPR